MDTRKPTGYPQNSYAFLLAEFRGTNATGSFQGADESDSESDDEYENEQEQIENEQEKIRIENYDAHVKLVDEGLNTSSVYYFVREIEKLQPLNPPQPRFADSEKQGIPKSSNEERPGENLFHTILGNEYLNSNEKSQLLLLVLQKAYAPYYYKLLKSPCSDDLLADPLYLNLVKLLYKCSLADKTRKLDADIETKIWQMFLHVSQGVTLFSDILEATCENHDRLMQFIVIWINAAADADAVINTYDFIEVASRRRQQLTSFMPEIQKTAKLRILDLELSEQSANLLMYEAVQPIPESGVVKEFLNSHRFSIFWGGWGTTTSTWIHNLIQTGDVALAQEKYGDEKIRLEADITNKLGREPGEHTFRMRS